MANNLIRKKPNRLLTGRNNYYMYGGANRFDGGGNLWQ